MVNFPPKDLAISVVTYSPDISWLTATLESLCSSIQFAKDKGRIQSAVVCLVDNGPGDGWRLKLQSLVDQLEYTKSCLEFSIISGHGNIGFGAGHNLAIKKLSSRFYLILNPDIILDSRSIAECFQFMEAQPKVICISPYSESTDGKQQFLCKRYPALLNLGLRGFAPQFVQRIFHKYLAGYEMREECGNESVLDVSIVSGCFMFFRAEALKELGGFSPKYFLYFEDFDLSLRAGQVGQLAYVPTVKVSHFGGETARKGWRHILMFVRSCFTFFQTHGWKLW